MNLYSLFENSNDKTRLDELPKWLKGKAKGLLGKDGDEGKPSDLEDLERQAAQIRAGGGQYAFAKQKAEPQSAGDCNPDDEECLQRFQHLGKHPSQVKGGSSPVRPRNEERTSEELSQEVIRKKLAAHITQYEGKWLEQYPQSAHGAIKREIDKIAKSWSYIMKEWYDEHKARGISSYVAKRLKDGVVYYEPLDDLLDHLTYILQDELPSAAVFWNMDESVEPVTESDINDVDKLTAAIADEAYKNHPELFKEYGDEYVMSAIDEVAAQYINSDVSIDEMLYALAEKLDGNEEITEGAATVFSDAVGHHLKNADGTIVQSFPKTAEGLRAARNALYANFNSLSVETPKESVMKEYEEQFNAALNESMTVNTTASTDSPDTVNVTATDEDAHTLVAILKAAGLPYKEHEAKIIAATPCGEQVEEEYANEPNEVTMSTDFMVNKLAGGLNRAKSQYKKEYPGDNPMAVNEENLMRGLWDLYKKV
jgi:hypothetical protein